MNCRNEKNNKIPNSVVVALLLLMTFSIYKIINIKLQYKQANDRYEAIAAETVIRTGESGDLTIDHTSLSEMNPDYIGWLDVPGTEISYPVVYASDYEEYLRTDFNGEYSFAGTLFTDYRCAKGWNSRSTIVYGHRMNDGSMFGTLAEYKNEEFFNAHREIDIYTSDGLRVYEIFSVQNAEGGDWRYTVSFASDEDYVEWLNDMKTASLFETGVDVSSESEVVVLSTCVGGNNNRRIIVAAILRES